MGHACSHDCPALQEPSPNPGELPRLGQNHGSESVVASSPFDNSCDADGGATDFVVNAEPQRDEVNSVSEAELDAIGEPSDLGKNECHHNSESELAPASNALDATRDSADVDKNVIHHSSIDVVDNQSCDDHVVSQPQTGARFASSKESENIRSRNKKIVAAMTLVLVAIFQAADFGTDVVFAITMRVRGKIVVFFVTIASLVSTMIFKMSVWFWVDASFGGPLTFVYLSSVLVGLDGLVLTLWTVWSNWGQLDPRGLEYRYVPVTNLLIHRGIEIVLESSVQAVVQLTTYLLDLAEGAHADAWQLVSLVASLTVVALGMDSIASICQGNEAFVKTWFDRVVCLMFWSFDTLLRISTFAICFASPYALYPCMWWVLYALIVSGPILWRQKQNFEARRIPVDALYALVMSLANISTCFSLLIGPNSPYEGDETFSDTFRDRDPRVFSQSCSFIRQFELLVFGILGLSLLEGYWRSLSLVVVAVWPLASMMLLRLSAITQDVAISRIVDALKLDFDAAPIDKMCFLFWKQLAHVFCCKARPASNQALADLVSQPVPLSSKRKEWVAKAGELAERGVQLGHILDFYAMLGSLELMPEFDPKRSTTNDVVREAIIPYSWNGTFDMGVDSHGKSLAQVLQKEPLLATRLVSHTWTNLFSNTLAAMVADALNLSTYDSILPYLTHEKLPTLKAELDKQGALAISYWFCAISVNQHANICGGFGTEPPQGTPEFATFDSKRRNTVTNRIYPACRCSTPKHFNDSPDQCEINKFDDMMCLMAKRLGSEFKLVVAVDPAFELFTRIWCIAELVEARKLSVGIKLKLPSAGCLKKNGVLQRMRKIRVQDCEATRKEDVDDVLAKIGDEAAMKNFNSFVQRLIFDEDTGIIAEFLRDRNDSSLRGEVIGLVATAVRAMA